MDEAYLGLGGNVGDVQAAIGAALAALGCTPGVRVERCSSLYRTEPVGGPAGQPDYINAAARVLTELSPADLLAAILAVEKDLGRVRGERWGPRAIDIDILLWGSRVVTGEGLTIPHPRLRERLFALVPLCEIAPADMRLPPDGMTLSQAVSEALDKERRILAEFRGQIVAPSPVACG